MSNRPHFLTSMSGVIRAFQRHIAPHLTRYGRKYRHFNQEVAEYIGRSVVVLLIILRTRMCAGTFMYILWYTSTLVPKKNFERTGHAPLLGTYIYVVLRTWY
jgi:hypothetical protein